MRKKRILVLADFHCGHLTGLTPPDWQWDNESETAWRKEVCRYQKWAWKTYMAYLDEFRPFQRLIVLGDCVDGKGRKSGGNEQLTTKRSDQVDMAVACIKAAGVQRQYITITRGTEYHVGVDDQWEDEIARELKCKICNHAFIDIKGVPFAISARHFVGGTQVAQGKATAVLRAQISNDQWIREYEEHPKANIFLRGHIHRNIIVDEPATLSIVAPALQGWTDFGAKKCSLPVHFGIIGLDLYENGERDWFRRTAQLGQFVQKIQW